jgi:adenylyltransferase/sulfurtransferase
VFNGLTAEAYQVEYQRKADCLSHDALDEVISLDAGVADMTVAGLLVEARRRLGRRVELELMRDMLEKLVCPQCHREQPFFTSLGQVTADQGPCPACGHPHRDVVSFYRIRGDECYLGRTLAEIGVPPMDIIVARADGRSVGFELAGDAAAVLGPLYEGEEAIEWS